MGEEEERELLREIVPDQEPEKMDAAQRMLALAWRCDKAPVKIRAPCVQCNGVVFGVLNRGAKGPQVSVWERSASRAGKEG
jgi:hypothetical protein